jgi:hypothetical protein
MKRITQHVHKRTKTGSKGKRNGIKAEHRTRKKKQVNSWVGFLAPLK